MAPGEEKADGKESKQTEPGQTPAEPKPQSDPLETPSTADVFGRERSTDPAKNPFIPNDCALSEEDESNLSQTSVTNEDSCNGASKPSSLQVNTSIAASRQRQSSLSTVASTPSPSGESIAKRKAQKLPQIQIPQLGNGMTLFASHGPEPSSPQRSPKKLVVDETERPDSPDSSTSVASSSAEDRVPQTAELLTQLASMPGSTPEPFGPPGKTTLSGVKSQLLQVTSGLSVTSGSDPLGSMGGSAIPSESINRMIGAAGNSDLHVSNPAVSFLSSIPLNTQAQIRLAPPANVQAQQTQQVKPAGNSDTLVNLAIKVGDRVVNLPLKLTPEQLALATGGGGLSVVPPAALPQPQQPQLQQPMLPQHTPIGNVRRTIANRTIIPESSMDSRIMCDDSLSPPSNSLSGFGSSTSFGATDAELRASQLLRAVAGGGPSASPSYEPIGLSPPPSSTPRWTSVQERNKAAAVRYRKRKKDELIALQKRVVELETKNLELNTQVNVLKDELDRVNDILDEHRDCPINVNKRRRIDNNPNQIIVRTSLSSTLAAADSTQSNAGHQQQLVVDPASLLNRSMGVARSTTAITTLGQNGGIVTSQSNASFEVGSPAADMLVNALTGTLNSSQASDLSAALGQAIQRQDSTGMGSTLTNLDTGRSAIGAGTATTVPASSAAIVEWLAQQQAASGVNVSGVTTLSTGQAGTIPSTTVGQQGAGNGNNQSGIVLQPIMIPGLNHSVLLPYLQLKTEPGQAHQVVTSTGVPISSSGVPASVGQQVVVVSSGELK